MLFTLKVPRLSTLEIKDIAKMGSTSSFSTSVLLFMQDQFVLKVLADRPANKPFDGEIAEIINVIYEEEISCGRQRIDVDEYIVLGDIYFREQLTGWFWASKDDLIECAQNIAPHKNSIHDVAVRAYIYLIQVSRCIDEARIFYSANGKSALSANGRQVLKIGKTLLSQTIHELVSATGVEIGKKILGIIEIIRQNPEKYIEFDKNRKNIFFRDIFEIPLLSKTY